MLLLNIARAKHHVPVHFTTVSSIAATFNFRVNSGVTGVFGNTRFTNPLTLNFNTEVEENPTINIIPVQGEDFTKRLLTPMDEAKFEFILHQGMNAAIVLRLIAGSMIEEHGDHRQISRNAPLLRAQFEEFRRRIMHLAALNERDELFVDPIVFEDEWPGEYTTDAVAVALGNGYRWISPEPNHPRVLSTKVVGRMLVSNYDPARRPLKERRQLQHEAQRTPLNFMLVDIRPGYPGGDFPFHGWVKLRNFRAVLEFIGHGISEEPEFHVDPDPRTGPVRNNPARTLHIRETETRPDDAAFAETFNGRVYSISNDSRWDMEGFRVLHQLFQMTMTDVTKVAVPAITIAK